MKKKQFNNHGSVLQIVLVIFLFLIASLSWSVYMMSLEVQSYHSIDILMKQKNLEILLTHYYLEQIENDILISDSVEYNGYEISYSVDDMIDYYKISTYIFHDDEHYQFQLKIMNNGTHDVSLIYEEE